MLETRAKVQSLYSTRATSKRAENISENPFKSDAYRNEKHSRSISATSCDKKSHECVAQQKNRALNGTRFSLRQCSAR
jgi:hypothetical protein